MKTFRDIEEENERDKNIKRFTRGGMIFIILFILWIVGWCINDVRESSGLPYIKPIQKYITFDK